MMDFKFHSLMDQAKPVRIHSTSLVQSLFWANTSLLNIRFLPNIRFLIRLSVKYIEGPFIRVRSDVFYILRKLNWSGRKFN